METWAQWARSKFDTVLLLLLFAFMVHFADMDMHKEILGALLLALTGSRNKPDAVPPAIFPNQPASETGQKE